MTWNPLFHPWSHSDFSPQKFLGSQPWGAQWHDLYPALGWVLSCVWDAHKQLWVFPGVSWRLLSAQTCRALMQPHNPTSTLPQAEGLAAVKRKGRRGIHSLLKGSLLMQRDTRLQAHERVCRVQAASLQELVSSLLVREGQEPAAARQPLQGRGSPYLQLLHAEFFAMLLGTVHYEIQSITVVFGVVSLQFFLYSLLHKLM